VHGIYEQDFFVVPPANFDETPPAAKTYLLPVVHLPWGDADFPNAA
jgi:hypothetical protein